MKWPARLMNNNKILVLENDDKWCSVISGSDRQDNFVFCADMNEFREKLNDSFLAVMIDSMLHTKDNGIRILRELKSSPRFAGIPAILIADDSPFFSSDILKKFGADLILFKPLTEQKVMRILKSILLLKAA